MRALSPKLSSLDRRLAATEDVVVLGPLDLPDLAALRSAAVQLAAAVPEARLDRLLDPVAGRWVPRPETGAALGEALVLDAGHLDAEALGFGDFARQAAVLRPERSPVVWVVAGDWIALAVSHAIGDAALINLLAAGLVQTAATGEAPAPPADRCTAHPTLRAVAHHWGRRPARVAQTLAAVRRVRASGEVPPTVDASATAAPAAVHAVTTAGATADLKAWTRAHAADATPLAVQTLLASRALEAVGLTPARHAIVLYDVRAYLPSGLGARGNFAVGVAVPLGSPADLATTDAGIREAFEVGRPLTALAAGRVKQVLARLPGAPARWRADGASEAGAVAGTADADVAADGAAHHPVAPPVLVVTSLGRRTEVERLPWRATGGPDDGAGRDAVFSALNHPAPGQITFASTFLAGRRQHSLSFDAAVFPQELLARAVDLMASDPVGLLGARGA